jgi:ribosomal protein L11 methyltransferase
VSGRRRSWPALELRVRPAGAIPGDPETAVSLAIDDLAVRAVEEIEGEGSPGAWRVHFDAPADRDRAGAQLAGRCGHWLEIAAVDVEDGDWARKVQAELRAVRVGRIIVAPPWDVPPPGERAPGDHLIVIEPSTGFGTGHHESTRLCLAALQSEAVAGRTVVDVGTGSGILAMAARRLGAAAVWAIDNDPDAVAAARANLARNPGLDGISVTLADAGTAPASLPPADLVLANLTAHAICRLAPGLIALSRPGGRLVTAGFTTEQAPLVADAFPGSDVAARLEEGGWVALVFARPARAPDLDRRAGRTAP